MTVPSFVSSRSCCCSGSRPRRFSPKRPRPPRTPRAPTRSRVARPCYAWTMSPIRSFASTTRIRHTTVIQLPAHETILDFVVGDSEYWHLTGAANLAFLKPIGERVTTNVALVCESGRIYSFLVTERAAAPAPGRTHPRSRRGRTAGHRPCARVRRAIARGRVPTHGRGQPTRGARGAGPRPRKQIAAACTTTATAQMDHLSGDLSDTAASFPYQLDDKAAPLAVPGRRDVARRPAMETM